MALPQRVQTGGSAAFAGGVSQTLYTVPASLNLYLDFISVNMLAILATGITVQVKIDGNIIATLSPTVGALTIPFAKPMLASTSIVLVASATTAGSALWGIGGDLR